MDVRLILNNNNDKYSTRSTRCYLETGIKCIQCLCVAVHTRLQLVFRYSNSMYMFIYIIIIISTNYT